MEQARDRELDASIAEFKALRDESLHYLKERSQLLWLATLICGGMLSYSIEAQNGYLAAFPMFFAFGSMLMCLAAFNAPQRIGAYIRTFIEQRHNGFYWERALRESYLGEKRFRRVIFGNRIYVILGYVVIYSSFGVASCILTNQYGPRKFALPASYLGMFLISVGDVLLIYLPLRRMRKVWAHYFELSYKKIFQDKMVCAGDKD